MTDTLTEGSDWREAGRQLNFFGIPALSFLLYLAWFRFPCLNTLFIVTAILALLKLIAWRGYTLPVIIRRILHLIRGRSLTGQPWWYRRSFE